jgi:hypothetical protein
MPARASSAKTRHKLFASGKAVSDYRHQCRFTTGWPHLLHRYWNSALYRKSRALDAIFVCHNTIETKRKHSQENYQK